MKISARSIFVCVGLAAMSLMLATTSYAELPGAVAIYTFDEGDGKVAKDSSRNGNDGKFIGNPQWVGGKFGKALSFSGQNDYVEIADSDGLDIKKAITLMAWVYPTKLSKNVEGIIAKWRAKARPNLVFDTRCKLPTPITR